MNPVSETEKLIADLTAELIAAGIENPRREVEWMVQDVTGFSRLELITGAAAPLGFRSLQALHDMVKRRIQREPIQYILGEVVFYGRTFQVSPAVLIPRPETEELVERVLSLPSNILEGGIIDLGTGSGCIPVTIACERPGTTCFGIDVSPAALEMARTNATRLDASVRFEEADMRDADLARMLDRSFSVLISNPPYVPDSESDDLQPEVRDHEPHIALFSGPDPLHFYRAIAVQALRLVTPEGYVFVEVHADKGATVAELFSKEGLQDIHVHRDLAGRQRIVEARRP